MTDQDHDHTTTLMAVPPSFTRAELDGLVRMMDTVAQSWADGDIAGVLALLRPSADFTLMPPDGGPSVPRPDDLAAYAEETSKSFAGGEAVFELEQSYASGDLAVRASFVGGRVSRWRGSGTRCAQAPESRLSPRLVSPVFSRNVSPC